jgi:phosphatidylserine/phosphatidylglycerophosphate/cardiolipin synthase-like enzyme
MGDAAVVDALISAARRGVAVRVCGENTYGEYDSEFAKLARAGVRVSYYSDPGGFYIHGKVIEADYGTRHAKVFIGSENFSSTSLNRNRELGLSSPARPLCRRWPGPSPPISAAANTGHNRKIGIIGGGSGRPECVQYEAPR